MMGTRFKRGCFSNFDYLETYKASTSPNLVPASIVTRSDMQHSDVAFDPQVGSIIVGAVVPRVREGVGAVIAYHGVTTVSVAQLTDSLKSLRFELFFKDSNLAEKDKQLAEKDAQINELRQMHQQVIREKDACKKLSEEDQSYIDRQQRVIDRLMGSNRSFFGDVY